MSSCGSSSNQERQYCKRHINRLIASEKKRQRQRLGEIVDEVTSEELNSKFAHNNYEFHSPEISSTFHGVDMQPCEGAKLLESDDDLDVLEEEEEKETTSLVAKLANWAVTCSVPHAHVNMLLKILHEENLHVPLCSKTLLKTPGTCTTIPVDPGQYCHLGVQEGILSSLKDKDNIPNPIKININVDGLPISEKASFWPILGNIVGFPEVFLVGVYHGIQKPTDAQQYLSKLINDINSVQDNGMTIKDRHYNVLLNTVIYDAPAKAFILCVKGHNAAIGCNKCTTEGTYMQHTMTFPETNSPLRTDYSFRQRLQEDYHKGTSPLESINRFDLINQIPLDYMHLVLLGVMKKILVILTKGKMGSRLVPEKIEEVNRKLHYLRSILPNNIFSRKPADLGSVDKWKATEFRQFLLYTGPFIFRGILAADQYAHFLLLHVGIRILCHPHLSKKKAHLDNAQKLLLSFVEEYGSFYGENNITYNVHNLVHLTNDAVLHGPLDNFSAFPFENHMREIKKCVRSSNFQLQQLIKRTMEKRSINRKRETKKEYMRPIKTGDSFILDGDQLAVITQCHNEQSVQAKVFKCPVPLYKTPYDSRILGVFVFDSDVYSNEKVSSVDLKQTCVCIPNSKDLIVFQVLHMS